MLAFPAFSVWDAACHSLFVLFIDFLFFFFFSVILSAWTLGVFSFLYLVSQPFVCWKKRDWSFIPFSAYCITVLYFFSFFFSLVHERRLPVLSISVSDSSTLFCWTLLQDPYYFLFVVSSYHINTLFSKLSSVWSRVCLLFMIPLVICQ